MSCDTKFLLKFCKSGRGEKGKGKGKGKGKEGKEWREGAEGRRKEGWRKREGEKGREREETRKKHLLKIEQNNDIKRGTIYRCWVFYSWKNRNMVQICYLESFPIPKANYYTNEALPCRKELCL